MLCPCVFVCKGGGGGGGEELREEIFRMFTEMDGTV